MIFGLQKERRRPRKKGFDLSIRFRLYLPSKPELTSSSFPAQLYDLSEHGMCLLTNDIQNDGLHILFPHIKFSEQCLMEIIFPDTPLPLTLQGKAIWYDRNNTEWPFIFRAGVQFMNLSRDLKKHIQSLINGVNGEGQAHR